MVTNITHMGNIDLCVPNIMADKGHMESKEINIEACVSPSMAK